MKLHMWVSMQYTPLDVERTDNGTIIVTAAEAAISTAEEDAMMGCWFCHTPLTSESFDTECIPEAMPKNNSTEP